MPARLRDTAWVTFTLLTGSSGWDNGFGCHALGSRDDGVVWGLFTYSSHWPPTYAYNISLWSFQVRDSELSLVQITGGSQVGIWGTSGCIDTRSSVHSCYYYYPTGLCLDQATIDTTNVERTAVKFDSLDRPQIAYVPSAGGLLYRYLDAGVWHIFDLQTEGVTALSLIIGENSQPTIAYTTSEGVFLAHGVDVAGQGEEQGQPMAFDSRLTASVIRNVLLLPEASSLKPQAVSWLLDAAGREVLGLRPGANDVSRLSPGIYFVREAQAQAVRKVVITR